MFLGGGGRGSERWERQQQREYSTRPSTTNYPLRATTRQLATLDTECTELSRLLVCPPNQKSMVSGEKERTRTKLSWANAWARGSGILESKRSGDCERERWTFAARDNVVKGNRIQMLVMSEREELLGRIDKNPTSWLTFDFFAYLMLNGRKTAKLLRHENQGFCKNILPFLTFFDNSWSMNHCFLVFDERGIAWLQWKIWLLSEEFFRSFLVCFFLSETNPWKKEGEDLCSLNGIPSINWNELPHFFPFSVLLEEEEEYEEFNNR